MDKFLMGLLQVLDVDNDHVATMARHNAWSSTAIRVVNREAWYAGGGSGYVLGVLVTTGYGPDEHVTMAGAVETVYVEGGTPEVRPNATEVVWFGNFEEPVEPDDPRHDAASELLVELFVRHSLTAAVEGVAVEEGYPHQTAAAATVV
jgi:hypothetical protein